MKKGVFCLALTAVLTLQSCSIKNNSREDLTIRIENSLVDNVYKHIKMDYFHGFIDRQTVDDLIKYHGQPDSIFDAYESTTIENYDIYEYRFDDGAINCYVPHNGDGVRYVEYIYFEFKKDMDLSEVVTDGELVKQIKDSGADVYYVADAMRVFVRIHLDPRDKSKSKVGNISLNDVSFLEERTPISDFVSEIGEKVPFEYGDLGNLTSVKIEKDTLKFAFHQDFVEQDLFLANIEKSKDIEKSLIIHLFGPSGNLNYIAKDIIDEHFNITFDFLIGDTGINKHYTISYEDFSKLFNDGITSHDILVAYIAINNLAYPFLIDDHQGNVVEVGCAYLSDSTLVYPVIFKSGTKEAKEALRKNFLGGLLNVDNPDRMTIYHAVRDNKAFTMDFLDEKTHEHNPKALTREKTIILYHSIASQPQNE